MSFHEILAHCRKISFSERAKGDRFERLMQVYLNTDPKYASYSRRFGFGKSFPEGKILPVATLGTDLVALTHDRNYWPASKPAISNAKEVLKMGPKNWSIKL